MHQVGLLETRDKKLISGLWSKFSLEKYKWMASFSKNFDSNIDPEIRRVTVVNFGVTSFNLGENEKSACITDV